MELDVDYEVLKILLYLISEQENLISQIDPTICNVIEIFFKIIES